MIGESSISPATNVKKLEDIQKTIKQDGRLLAHANFILTKTR